MESIDPTIKLIPSSPYQLPQDLVMKEAFGLVFKEVLNSLAPEDDELADAFRTDEDREAQSGIASNFPGYSQQFADLFLKSAQGQQILNEIHKQYPVSVDGSDQRNNIE